MGDLVKVKLSKIFSSAVFWMAIAVIYLQSRGLSLSQIYQLLSIYYISVVLLEFPTGVIGDYFSHKLSVILGSFILGIGIIAMGFDGNFNYYLIVLIFVSLGVALTSGSDTALLHSLSKDFKQDQSQIRFYSILVAVITTALGSILYTFNLNLPFFATGLFNIVTACLLLSVKDVGQERRESNIFKAAFKSLAYVKTNKKLLSLLIISGAVGAFIYSLKWFYNPLLGEMGVPVSFWGVLISGTLLVPLIGIKIYQRISRSSLILIFILFVLSIIPIGLTQFATVSLVVLYIHSVIRGYLETMIDVEINNTIQSRERASILSLNNLLIRLGATAYTPVAGMVLERSSFLTVTTGTAVLLLLIGVYPAFVLWMRS